MLRIVGLLLLVIACGDSGFAGPYSPEPDYDRYSSGNEVGRFLGKAIPWLLIVVGIPLIILSWIRQGRQEAKMTDEEFRRQYPFSTREKPGIGTYLMYAYIAVGLGGMWLAFASPTAFGWLLGLSR